MRLVGAGRLTVAGPYVFGMIAAAVIATIAASAVTTLGWGAVANGLGSEFASALASSVLEREDGRDSHQDGRWEVEDPERQGP